jgi:glutamyl/glutaminyl-tRNA synthetase
MIGHASKVVEIYTDGACKGNPGIGGWGALLRYGDHEREIFGGEKLTTNNRMELLAAIRALESLKRPCKIHLHTDSQYLQKGISEWLDSWKARNWLSIKYAQAAEIRLYDRLFTDPYPDSGNKDYKTSLNSNSKQIITAYVEPSLCEAKPEQSFQFERNGYFIADRMDMKSDKPAWNYYGY